MKKKLGYVKATALVVYRTLKNGARPTSTEIRDLVNGVDGADARYLRPAAKWLRDRGIPVATIKARHMTTWFIAATPSEMEDYGKRVLQEAFSEIVSDARSCALLRGKGSRTARAVLVNAAISLGAPLNFSPEEVVEMCKPLHANGV